MLEGRVKLGAVTLNEMRDHLGLDPYANPAADRPMVLTATGYVPIEANASSPAGLTRGSMPPRSRMDYRVAPDNDASLHKYNPDQPRVPGGNPDGGQWTSEGDSGASSESQTDAGIARQRGSEQGPQYAAADTGTRTDATDVGTSADSSNGVVLAGDTVTPHGFTIQHLPGENPLDPQGLNKPISADEQQKVADALTLIDNGDVGTLEPHPYYNRPHFVTGAVLPPSAQGYTAYDVLGFGTGRGVNRLVVDNGTRAIYYTNNHYFSFYAVQLNLPGN